MDHIMKLFREFLAEALKWRAGQFFVSVQEVSMTQFKIEVLLPALVDADVESRELSVVINGLPPKKFLLATTEPSYTFLAPRDAVVTVALVDIDVSKNRSEPSSRTFTVLDTIAPHKPGELVVKVVDQIEE